MNWIDYIIILIVVAGALSGLRQGLVRQFVGVVGFAVGFIVASQYYGALATYFFFIPDQNWARIAAFGVIVIAIMGISGAVGQALHRMVGLMMFGCFDRWLGGAAGAFLNILLVETALIILKRFPVFNVDGWDSVVVRELLKYAPLLINLLPPEFEAVRQTLR